MNRSQVAASVAKNKLKHPELYCPVKGCLWRTGGHYDLCLRHFVRLDDLVQQGLVLREAEADKGKAGK